MTSEAEVQSVRDDINEFMQEYAATSPTEKGDRFLEWVYSNLLPPGVETVNLDGPGDAGMDYALYAANEIWVVQSKYFQSHSEDAAEAFNGRVQRIRGYLNGHQVNLSSELWKFLERLKYGGIELPQLSLHGWYVTNAQFNNKERLRYNLLQDNNPNLTILDIEGITAKLKEQQTSKLSVSGKLGVTQLPLVLRKDEAYVCIVTLESLARFADSTGPSLFDANVRYYLKRTAINKDIADTLEKEPADFFFYNNGITIVCQSVKLGNNPDRPEVELTGAQVVNGCQTVSEILNAWSQQAQPKKPLNGEVLVRVICNKPGDFKRKISQRTNRQNAVRARDFLAMVDEQKNLQRNFKLLGYYYEYRRGQAALLPAKDRRTYKGLPEYSYLERNTWRFKKIPAFDAQQCFLAAYLDKPGEAREKLGQYSPLEREWENMFDGISSPKAVDHLLPYLVHEAAREFDYGAGGADWKSFARLTFVCVVYRVLDQILYELEWPGAGDTVRDPLKLGLAIRTLLSNAELGERVLEIANGALEFYNEVVRATDKNYDARNTYRSDIHRKNKQHGDWVVQAVTNALGRRDGRRVVSEARILLFPSGG